MKNQSPQTNFLLISKQLIFCLNMATIDVLFWFLIIWLLSSSGARTCSNILIFRASWLSLISGWKRCVCVSYFAAAVSHQKLFVFPLWHNVDRCGSNTVSHIKQSFPYGKQMYSNSSDWLVQTGMKTAWLLWRISADQSCSALFIHEKQLLNIIYYDFQSGWR